MQTTTLPEGAIQRVGLEPGSQVSGRFEVIRAQLRDSKSGTQYLVMSLSAFGTELPAIMFEVADGYTVPRPGSQVDVRGIIQEYRGSLRLKIRVLAAVPGAAASLGVASGSSQTDGERFGTMLLSIEDVNLRESVKRVLRSNGVFRAFKRAAAPAALNPGSASSAGSALAQTLSVAAVAGLLCEPHPPLNRDVVLAAALLHLIGVIDVTRIPPTGHGDRYQVPVSVLSTHRIRSADRTALASRPPRHADLLRVEEVILGAAYELDAGAGASRDPEATVLAAAISATRAARAVGGTLQAPVQSMRCVG